MIVDAERKKKEYWKDPEKQRTRKREAQRRYDASHREAKKLRLKKWREKNQEKVRKQKGQPEPSRPKPLNCEICGSEKRICLDHCHETGNFRAWLCDLCNRTLGYAKDNPETLRKLATMLEEFSLSRSVAGAETLEEVRVCLEETGR